MKSNKRFMGKSLLASIILSGCISVIALVYSGLAINIERENCYTTLLGSTEEASSKIESNFKNDRASLRMLAKVIGQADELDSNEVNNQLGTYAVNNYISNIAILVPDGRILQSRHVNVENKVISYDTEVEKGEHISNLQPSTFLENKYVIRNYVPIGNVSSIKGILFTELDADAIVRAWSPSIYDGNATFCIVDRETGEVVVNGLDSSYTDITDIANTGIIDGIENGDTGYGEIELNGNKLLVAYKPMGIENWDILIIIESSIVFEPVAKLNKYLTHCLALGAIVFTIYLIWIIRCNIEEVQRAKDSANRDALTGLANRNRYEEFCSRALVGELTCIYIDVNGLHEVNNTKGHLAGDMMLKFIAEVLKNHFKDKSEVIYRIGGDEFVIFSNREVNKLDDIVNTANKEILKNEYHISYGLSHGTDLKVIIKDAEKKMYDMKKVYYESLGKEVRNKLES